MVEFPWVEGMAKVTLGTFVVDNAPSAGDERGGAGWECPMSSLEVTEEAGFDPLAEARVPVRFLSLQCRLRR